jgi:hypothetical protein
MKDKLLATIMRTQTQFGRKRKAVLFGLLKENCAILLQVMEIQKFFGGRRKALNFIRSVEMFQTSVVQSNTLSWRAEETLA